MFTVATYKSISTNKARCVSPTFIHSPLKRFFFSIRGGAKFLCVYLFFFSTQVCLSARKGKLISPEFRMWVMRVLDQQRQLAYFPAHAYGKTLCAVRRDTQSGLSHRAPKTGPTRLFFCSILFFFPIFSFFRELKNVQNYNFCSNFRKLLNF